MVVKMARRMSRNEQLHAIADYFKKEIKKFDALTEKQKKETAHNGLMEIGVIDADGNLAEPYRTLRESDMFIGIWIMNFLLKKISSPKKTCYKWVA